MREADLCDLHTAAQACCISTLRTDPITPRLHCSLRADGPPPINTHLPQLLIKSHLTQPPINTHLPQTLCLLLFPAAIN